MGLPSGSPIFFSNKDRTMNILMYLRSPLTRCTGSDVMPYIEGGLDPKTRAMHWCMNRPDCIESCVMFNSRNASIMARLLKVGL